MNTDISYRGAFKQIGRGSIELSECIARTFINSCREVALGAWHHPIVTLLLLAVVGSLFKSMCTARTERDNFCKTAYELQQKNDSLTLMVEPIVEKNSR